MPRRFLAALLTSSVLAMPAGVRALPLNACSPSVTRIASGFGSPDDVAVDGSRLLFGDFTGGRLAAEQNGSVRTLVSGLSGPEGIIVRPNGHVVVAEQGANRLTDINLTNLHRRVILRLQNLTGKEGVDGIGPAPGGGIYVPDSPYGRLYLLDRGGHLRLLAQGLGRPVGALRFHQGVAVPDENALAVWLVKNGQPQRLATLQTPDDVIVMDGALLAVTLGDGALWEVWPHILRLVGGFGAPQGIARLNGDSAVVVDSNRNGLFRVSGLRGCLR